MMAGPAQMAAGAGRTRRRMAVLPLALAGSLVAASLAIAAWLWWMAPPASEAVVIGMPALPAPAAPVEPEKTTPLSPAPDPALVAPGRGGPLPVVAADGRQAWQVYARPFDAADRRPRVALVVAGLGLSEPQTSDALRRLPGAVTLGFIPYAADLQYWIGAARTAGHEILLQAPMEPADYPASDPGPNALMTRIGAAGNIERLEWLLGRSTGYIGIANIGGGRFGSSPADLRPVLAALQSRGLMYFDGLGGQDVPAGRIAKELALPFADASGGLLDAEPSRAAIDRRLAELEALATRHGAAAAVASPYPVSIERIVAWSQGLAGRGIALAPISALAAQRVPR